MKKLHIILLAGAVFISLFFNLYHKTSSPPAFNADEAAFGYNAYSLLKTGRDEYGTVLPLRLKSFGDYKMPLYSYLSVPFVAIFGLNEMSTRFLNTIIAALLPIAVFFFCQELFKKIKISILAAYLISFSLGLHIVGRHAHEAYLAAFLICCTSIFFLKILNKPNRNATVAFFLCLLLALFAYQSSRIFAVFFAIATLLAFYQKRINKFFIVYFVIVLLLFGMTDVVYKPERVKNLLFFNNFGFKQKIIELKNEGGNFITYNTVTVGIRDISIKTLQYFSPSFLVDKGDDNVRFGLPGMAPMTVTSYLFIFIGIYYLFKRKEKWRFFLLALFLVSPLSASLAWADFSLTRSLFLLIPALILSAYGIISFIEEIQNKKIKIAIIILIVMSEIYLLFYSWDFYLNHYPKRALPIRTWESGYKELVQYLQKNYSRFDTFYITRKHGQPYIFVLFYQQYPPEKYQKQAKLSAPDEYGFGQVEKFDKYNFNFALPKENGRSVSIGYPDDFLDPSVDSQKIKKIKYSTEEIFWIYQK